MQLLTTCRSMPSQLLSSILQPVFPLIYILSMTSYGMEYPFGQFESAVLAESPPNFLYPPAYSLAGQYEKLKSP